VRRFQIGKDLKTHKEPGNKNRIEQGIIERNFGDGTLVIVVWEWSKKKIVMKKQRNLYTEYRNNLQFISYISCLVLVSLFLLLSCSRWLPKQRRRS